MNQSGRRFKNTFEHYSVDEQNQLLHIFILFENGNVMDAMRHYSNFKGITPITLAKIAFENEYNAFNSKQSK